MYLPTRLPEVETETREQSPFTLDALIAWLRTKNPEERYSFWNTNICPFAQYGRFIGLWGPDVFATVQDGIARHYGLSWWNKYRLIGPIVSRHPRTFGAALSRATAIRGV